MGNGRMRGRRAGTARWAASALAAGLVVAVASAGAAEPDFSTDERRRLARITGLPVEGDLDAAKIDAVTFTTISPEKLADFGDADCRALGRMPKLTSFTLRGLPLSAACVDALPRSPMSLTLDGVTFAADTLPALGRMPGLVNLRIEGGAGISTRLVEIFPPTSRLVRVSIGNVDGETLAALRRVARLTELEIGEVVGPLGLAPLDGAPEIERLVTAATTAADLETVARLPKLAELSTGLGEGVGEAELRVLARSKTLRSVALQFAEETGAAGVGVLAEMPRLEELKLVYQKVPDRELARLARSPSLTHLDLREAEVAEAGLLALTRSHSLRGVNLWRVGVSDKVRRRLAKRFTIE